MFRNDFRLKTTWDLDCTAAELRAILDDILADPDHFSRICPRVFRDIEQTRPSDPDGTGGVIRLVTAGRLPYTLAWQVRLVESVPMTRYVQEATGDFEGRAVWTITKIADGFRIGLDWRLRVNKPLIRWTLNVLKPLFVLNHRWAMAIGRATLERELQARRRGGPCLQAA